MTVSDQRIQTATPLQQLFFLNSSFAQDRARGLAARVEQAGDNRARIREAYRILFQRAPDPEEMKLGAAVSGVVERCLAALCAGSARFQRAGVCRVKEVGMISRRELLAKTALGFGALSLNRLLAESAPREAPEPPLTHFPAKAKHVIYLFLNGGPSQVDTWDPKPLLTKYHGTSAPGGNLKTERKTGNLMKSPFEFRRCGRSGVEVSEIFPKLGERIDDICVIRSMHVELPNHEPSLFMFNTGHMFAGHPSMGSWLTYGLGTQNQNLPGFVVLCPGFPVVGPQLWSSAYLPGIHQGVYLPNNEKEPEKLIQHLRNRQMLPDEQRRQLELMHALNRHHLRQTGQIRSSRRAFSRWRSPTGCNQKRWTLLT